MSSTVKNALCMPAKDFHTKNYLSSFRDIYWAFSSSNLTHKDKVLIFGEQQPNNFLAALLFLSGQKQVFIWQNTQSNLMKHFAQGAGIKRQLFRTQVYLGKMRDQYMDFKNTKKSSATRVLTQQETPLMSEKIVINFSDKYKSLGFFAQLMTQGYQNVKVRVD